MKPLLRNLKYGECFKDLLDPNREQLLPIKEDVPDTNDGIMNLMMGQNQSPTTPLPNTPTPDVSQVNLNQDVDSQTGLTTIEEALLSPSEKAIRLNQTGMA